MLSPLGEQLVAVFLDDRLQPLDLLRGRLLVGWQRERAALSRLTGRPDDVLDAAWDEHEEHSAAPMADREAVGDVARPEDEVASARLDRLIADLEGDFALEDPESLVVTVMDVERRLRAGVFGHLHDRHLAARVGGGGLDLRERPEPPARLALVLADRPRLQRLHLTRLLRHRCSSVVASWRDR